ncbi:MAG: phosphatase PAP2 family protein [Promethearchaeia archaeon]
MEMEKDERIISKKGLIIIGLVSLTILVIGLILLGLFGLQVDPPPLYTMESIGRTIFQVITYTGESIFFVLFVAILFFIYDKKFAKNLGLILLFSVYINGLFKDVFKLGRPSTNFINGAVEKGYGFPSGHSQNAVAFWGYIGHKVNKKTKMPYIVPIAFSILIFFIAVSRLVIGVHFLEDIVGGLLIGIGVFLLFVYLEPLITPKFNKLSLSMRILLVVIASVLLFLLGTLLFPYAGFGSVEAPHPWADAGGYAQVGGAILGIGVGYLLEAEKVKYKPGDLNISQKVLNLIIGLLITILAYIGLGLLTGIFSSVIYRFIRYAIVTFLVSFVIPLIFTKIQKKNKKPL